MIESISNLVEKFSRNIDEYKNPKYNETSVRIEFVNPFWEALGRYARSPQPGAVAAPDRRHRCQDRPAGL